MALSFIDNRLDGGFPPEVADFYIILRTEEFVHIRAPKDFAIQAGMMNRRTCEAGDLHQVSFVGDGGYGHFIEAAPAVEAEGSTTHE
jgi:hypothetical protein